MPNTKVSAVFGLALLTAALAANHAIGRIGGSELHIVPVWAFPRAVGAWHAGPDLPEDERVQKALPSAKIVERVYEDPAGRHVDVTLLTATEYKDFHDPNMCFPAQGFSLSDSQALNVGSQHVYSMVAARDQEKLRVLYYWTGDVMPEGQWGRVQLGRLMTIRNRLTNEHGESVFVRLVASDGPDAEKRLLGFARDIQAPLRELTAAKR